MSSKVITVDFDETLAVTTSLKRYGIEMEKMRLAMNKERERLSALHKYDDGQIDQPFLTPDTVIE